MITRRSVRTKAMQYIYAFETAQTDDISAYEQNLLKSIQSVKEQYLFVLFYLREVANYVETDAKIKSGKFIKTEKDKNFNTKLLSNILVQYLNNDTAFLNELKKHKSSQLADEELIRDLYKSFISAPEYQNYLNLSTEFDLEEDKKIVTFLLKDILLQNEAFMQFAEDNFVNWYDDGELVLESVDEVILKSKTDLKLHLNKEKLNEKFDELTKFGRDLFRYTIEHKKEYWKLIEPKLKNWDADRLAVVDMILMRMALTEFFNFPSIPLKVSINEYLDIAKEYSTPKSKDFINGVLDSLMRELKDSGKIQKTGRGLI